MKEKEYYREIETRERIVQIFLIVAGFFLAYSKEEIKQALVLTFILYVIFTLLYYIFLTRSKSNYSINMYGIMSSYSYSLLLMIFISSELKGISATNFLTLFVVFTALFSFALLSPATSEKIVNKTENEVEKFQKKHPKILTWVILLIAVIFSIYMIYFTLTNYKLI